jgi:hypothetical protein
MVLRTAAPEMKLSSFEIGLVATQSTIATSWHCKFTGARAPNHRIPCCGSELANFTGKKCYHAYAHYSTEMKVFSFKIGFSFTIESLGNTVASNAYPVQELLTADSAAVDLRWSISPAKNHVAHHWHPKRQKRQCMALKSI